VTPSAQHPTCICARDQLKRRARAARQRALDEAGICLAGDASDDGGGGALAPRPAAAARWPGAAGSPAPIADTRSASTTSAAADDADWRPRAGRPAPVALAAVQSYPSAHMRALEVPVRQFFSRPDHRKPAGKAADAGAQPAASPGGPLPAAHAPRGEQPRGRGAGAGAAGKRSRAGAGAGGAQAAAKRPKVARAGAGPAGGIDGAGAHAQRARALSDMGCARLRAALFEATGAP